MKLDLEHYGPGRPPLPETLARLNKMIKEIGKEPNIPSAKLAKLLGINSQECAALARRLEKRGFLVVDHQKRALTYRLMDEAA